MLKNISLKLNKTQKSNYKLLLSNHYINSNDKTYTLTNQSNALVICGPSGVGKGTIINKILELYPNQISLSVSHTSRDPRPGEIDGFHYHFVSKQYMLDKIKYNQSYFIENAVVHNNIYGTSYDAIQSIQSNNKICLLDVDINGVKQIKQSNKLNCYYIFIAPPSIEVLYQRLKNRGTETLEQLNIRYKSAELELQYGLTKDNFDKIIINDQLDKAIEELNEYLASKYPILR